MRLDISVVLVIYKLLCTLIFLVGYPADTHEPIWLTIHPKINNRCPHCGNVFKYEMEADH